MQDQSLEQYTKEVIDTINELVELLESLGAPEVSMVQRWKAILEGEPSIDEINEIWRQLQHVGTHIGYMDYTHPAYETTIERLLDQMEEIIAVTRRKYRKH